MLKHERTAQEDLRQKLASYLTDRIEQLTADSVAVFSPVTEPLDVDYFTRIGRALLRLLARTVREDRLDAGDELIADTFRLMAERSLSLERLFAFAYLAERTLLDELAIDEAIGVTTESWPLAAQLVRRASFDFLAACAERARTEPSDLTVIDRLTTLYARPLFDAVLAKELVRAGRAGYGVSLLLFDVDHLADINHTHGFGVGDKILERLGILIRKYFRQQDWAARYSGDSIAVLVTGTDADNASALADRLRETVEARLRFADHRDETPVRVTLSAAVVNMRVPAGGSLDADRLLAEAEAAVAGACQQGGNRVVRVDSLTASRET